MEFRIRLEQYVHIADADDDIIQRLKRLEHNQEQIRTLLVALGVQLMALSTESKALLEKLNVATTKVSDRIDALLSNPNTTEAEFRAALQPIADHLDAMGQDPANPVPPIEE